MKSFFAVTIALGLLLASSDRALASGSLSPWAVQAVSLVNGERTSRGLAPLAIDESLDRAAAAKLADMEAKQYFAHTSPAGVTPWSWIEGARYDYRFAGENLAIRFTDPDGEHAAWMASEKHCQNILDPRFKETGIAVKKVFFEGEETMLAVETFGTKRGDDLGITGTKEDALAMCHAGSPLVSGTSISGVGSGFVAGFLVSHGLSTGNLVSYAAIVSMILFALAELSAVILIVTALFRREWRNGVVV